MKTLNAYLFNELSQEAKDLAIHNFDTDELWDHEFSIEDMTSHLESLGLDNVEIQYSGFWSQGDGLSFTADVSDPELFLEHIGAPRLSEDLTDALDICFWRASHTTCHERSCSSSVNYTFLTEETQTEWDSNINHIATTVLRCLAAAALVVAHNLALHHLALVGNLDGISHFVHFFNLLCAFLHLCTTAALNQFATATVGAGRVLFLFCTLQQTA